MAMHGVFIHDANDRHGAKMNSVMLLLLESNQCYQHHKKVPSVSFLIMPVSQEQRSLTVDFRPAQNYGGSPAWASIVEVKKHFASALYQNTVSGKNRETRL